VQSYSEGETPRRYVVLTRVDNDDEDAVDDTPYISEEE
jgi:hypothetical protein